MHTLSLFEPFRGVLLDAYGVFWGGGIGVIPGSHETMRALVQGGKIVGILSNSSQSGEKEQAKFAKHGLIQNIHYHFVLTSGDIALALFVNRQLPFAVTHNNYWILGSPHPQFSSPNHIFEGTAFTPTAHLAQADFIIPGIPHRNGEDQTDPEVFREEVFQASLSRLPLVCVNPDTFAHEGTPPTPVVRQGSIAALYEEYGGTILMIGKPSPIAFNAALHSLSEYGVDSLKEIIMVGDTPETDIRGARNAGIASVLITQTGIFAHRYGHLEIKEALDLLPASDQPNFTLEYFPHDLCASS